MLRTTVHIKPRFMICCALMLLVFPFEWILSWLFAAAVHELFHYCALRVCGCDIYSVTVTPSGAVMETSKLNGVKGIVCYLAGPLGGFILCFFAKYFPVLAIFGFVQSVYNLIPLRPLDGGQALAVGLNSIMAEEKAEVLLILVGKLVFLTGSIVALASAFVLKTCLPLLILCFISIRYNRNTACNDG